jgi:PiT family inorganic phosphate transporter
MDLLSPLTAMALGTLLGGWRIIKMMGQCTTKLEPVGGFAAEAGGALTLFLASGLGVPVSTTHTITGAIVGVGATSDHQDRATSERIRCSSWMSARDK